MADVENYVNLMDRLETDAAALLKEYIEAAMDLALAYITAGTAANDPRVTTERAAATALAEVHSEAIDASMKLTQETLDQKADLLDQALTLFRQRFASQTPFQINETTYQTIRAMLLRRQRRGMSATQAAQEVSSLIPGLSQTRALVIARTEIHAASQFASQFAAGRSGLLLKKQWNTVLDERTRGFNNNVFSHRAMNGIQISLDNSFKIPRIGGGFEALLFPGDPNGSASNIINCRCVQTYERV